MDSHSPSDADRVWKPGVGIGPFVFGARVESLQELLGSEILPIDFDLDPNEKELAALSGDASLEFTDGRLDGISASDKFIAGSVNLMGAELEKFVEVFGPPSSIDDCEAMVFVKFGSDIQVSFDSEGRAVGVYVQAPD